WAPASLCYCVKGYVKFPTQANRQLNRPNRETKTRSGNAQGTPVGREKARSRAGGSAAAVRFLFDDSGARQLVDLALQRGAPVVVAVDGAGQFDKGRPELPSVFVFADVILDRPQRLVGFLEFPGQDIQSGTWRALPVPDSEQLRQFAVNVA